MTPNTNNTPRRISEVSDLVLTLADALRRIDEVKANAHECNCALAICEILTGLPPEWFTPVERLIVIGVIDGLHGDPMKFISEVMEGNLSFVNKAQEITQGKTCDELTTLVMRKHLMQFGGI